VGSKVASAWTGAGRYAKGIVFVASAVLASLQQWYGGEKWFTAAIVGVGALSAILVPNQPKQ